MKTAYDKGCKSFWVFIAFYNDHKLIFTLAHIQKKSKKVVQCEKSSNNNTTLIYKNVDACQIWWIVKENTRILISFVGDSVTYLLYSHGFFSWTKSVQYRCFLFLQLNIVCSIDATVKLTCGARVQLLRHSIGKDLAGNIIGWSIRGRHRKAFTVTQTRIVQVRKQKQSFMLLIFLVAVNSNLSSFYSLQDRCSTEWEGWETSNDGSTSPPQWSCENRNKLPVN